MPRDEQIEIRLLAAADVPAAMRLKNLARWNQTEDDWRRLLALEPRGCFPATVGGRVVGTTTTTRYGRDLAWVGMVLVDPDYRRRGIATRLMHAALEHLREEKVAEAAIYPADHFVFIQLPRDIEQVLLRKAQ